MSKRTDKAANDDNAPRYEGDLVNASEWDNKKKRRNERQVPNGARAG